MVRADACRLARTVPTDGLALLSNDLHIVDRSLDEARA